MTRRGMLSSGLAMLGVAFVVAGCATATEPKAPTLYERLRAVDSTGTTRQGRDAIAIVVNDFVANMVADPRVNARFKGMKPPEVEKLKSSLSDLICEKTGGPCSYYGKDMKAVHTGMKITDAEWNATVENMTKALDKSKVPERERKDLLAALDPMKADIVGQ